jgi:hypothetical protein
MTMNTENQHPLGSHAQHLQSYGRGEDTVLIHMTPREVSGLQELAMAHGGSLTINPHTGLPEAGFLSSILPMVLGGLLSFIPGVGPLAAAGIMAAGTTAVTGDLKQGLLAGLGAFGGASLAPGLAGAVGLGAAGSAGGAAAGAAGAASGLGTSAATGTGAGLLAGGNAAAATAGQTALMAGQQAIAAPLTLGSGALSGIGGGALSGAANSLTAAAGASGAASAAAPILSSAAAPAASGLASIAPTAALQTQPGFLTQFANNAAQAAKPLGIPRAAAVGLAGMGVANPFLQNYPSGMPTGDDGKHKWNYEGPYQAMPRATNFKGPQAAGAPMDTSEHTYFDNTNPYPGFVAPSSGNSTYMQDLIDSHKGYAEGGVVLKDGGFVVDARTVSELGNGSSGAGQELLAKYGGQAIKGGGDGVSDSVPASIGGKQPARVARDEVKFDPKAVARIGKGDSKRGAQKLYAMMAKAHSDRKNAGRGEDTKARGLEAIR